MFFQLRVQVRDERYEVNLHCHEPISQLKDVEAALPALDLAHQALVPPQPDGQIGLSKTERCALAP